MSETETKARQTKAARNSEGLTTLPADRYERKYQWVTFASGKAGEEKTVFVGLNGQFFRYPRGKRVLVPLDVINGVLKNAQVGVGNGNADAPEFTEEPAYPYQVHGDASNEEVDAYFAKKEQ